MNSWICGSADRPQAVHPALDLRQDTFQLHPGAGTMRAQRPNPYAQGTALHRAFELQSHSRHALSCCSERGYEACRILFCSIPQCLSSFVNLTLDDPSGLIRAVLEGRKMQEQLCQKGVPAVPEVRTAPRQESKIAGMVKAAPGQERDARQQAQGANLVILDLLSNYQDDEEPFVIAFPGDLSSDLIHVSPQDALAALALRQESQSPVWSEARPAAFMLALSSCSEDAGCAPGSALDGGFDEGFNKALLAKEGFRLTPADCTPAMENALYGREAVVPAWSFEQHAFAGKEAPKIKARRAPNAKSKAAKSKAASSCARQPGGVLTDEELIKLAAQNCSSASVWGLADLAAGDTAQPEQKQDIKVAPPSSFKLDSLCKGARSGAALKAGKSKSKGSGVKEERANLAEAQERYADAYAPVYHLDVPASEPRDKVGLTADLFKDGGWADESCAGTRHASAFDKAPESRSDIRISSVLSDRALEALLKANSSSRGANFKLERDQDLDEGDGRDESFYEPAGAGLNFELLQSLSGPYFDDAGASLGGFSFAGLSDGNFHRLDPYRLALDKLQDLGALFELELCCNTDLAFDDQRFWGPQPWTFSQDQSYPKLKAGQKGRARALSGARALKKARSEISKEDRLQARFSGACEQEALSRGKQSQKAEPAPKRSFDEELYEQALSLPSALLFDNSPLQLLSICSGQSRGSILSLAESFCTHPLKVLRAVCGAHENNALPSLLKHSLLLAGAKDEGRLHFPAPGDITACEMARLNAPSALIARLCRMHHSTSARLVQKCQSEGLCSKEAPADDNFAKSALYYLFLTLMVYFYNLSVTLLKLKGPGYFAELKRFDNRERSCGTRNAPADMQGSAEELKHSPQVMLPTLMVGAYKSCCLLYAGRLFDDARDENVFPSFAAFAGVLELLYKGKSRFDICLECGCHYAAPDRPGRESTRGLGMCKACALKKHHRFQEWAYSIRER